MFLVNQRKLSNVNAWSSRFNAAWFQEESVLEGDVYALVYDSNRRILFAGGNLWRVNKSCTCLTDQLGFLQMPGRTWRHLNCMCLPCLSESSRAVIYSLAISSDASTLEIFVGGTASPYLLKCTVASSCNCDMLPQSPDGEVLVSKTFIPAEPRPCFFAPNAAKTGAGLRPGEKTFVRRGRF